MTTNDSTRRINASPTKDFFIFMLTKDIELIRAIIDLIDNSVDGALRLRPNGDYTDLSVRIEVTKEYFKISDNCGGIPVDVAQNYAFRFGRPKDMQMTPYSVGQFGVGMKRSLFKLGTKIKIESTTERDHFIVEEDVDEWRKKEDWEFEFKVLEENLSGIDINHQGTTITVTALHESVAQDFDLENFQSRLRRAIERAHMDSMSKSLIIRLNEKVLENHLLMLLQSDQIKPAYKEIVFGETDQDKVRVRIYAGLMPPSPLDAGWYIFCNGRLILDADQTLITGWGENGGKTIPKYHNDYARFRGYTYFDANDASQLPWNTTKTGVDIDSQIFRTVRLEMIKEMRVVFDFLNKVRDERSLEEDERQFEPILAQSEQVKLQTISLQSQFSTPKPRSINRPSNEGRIAYSKPKSEIKRVQENLGVKTLKEVGERTFEYFLERECEE